MRLRLRSARRAPAPGLRPVPDDLPRDGQFAQPLRVVSVEADHAPVQGGHRVTFTVAVRDAADKRCPDLAVDATLAGPERTRSGQATTDLLGRVRFRMTGPAGAYRLAVDDVAAGGLAWDRTGSSTEAEISVE